MDANRTLLQRVVPIDLEPYRPAAIGELDMSKREVYTARSTVAVHLFHPPMDGISDFCHPSLKYLPIDRFIHYVWNLWNHLQAWCIAGRVATSFY